MLHGQVPLTRRTDWRDPGAPRPSAARASNARAPLRGSSASLSEGSFRRREGAILPSHEIGRPTAPHGSLAAVWDDELGAAMREARRAVHEEGVVEALLEDLRRSEGVG
ncbi:DUF2399 domain-containing protein [Sorangium sp. So ce1014]|uniref:DUF2399 domain-containing protein n=1 Tax=Sorangium sp. So ce1014 TaxID=3133326 RepID=UPI003F627DCE